MDWNGFVEIDKSLFRPKEVPYLCSKPEKVMQKLGWKPSMTFEDLVHHMVEAELAHV